MDKRVLVTRSAAQSVDLVNELSARNIYPYCLPMIETGAVADVKFLFDKYDICILTSPTAAAEFAPYAKTMSIKWYVAVGAVTASFLSEQMQIPPERIIVPKTFYLTEVMEILNEYDLRGRRVVSPGARKRIGDLSTFFKEKSAIFDAPVLYDTTPIKYEKGYVLDFIISNNINITTFFSPSAVYGFFDSISKEDIPSSLVHFTIGTTTDKALKENGAESFMPLQQTTVSMADAIQEYVF